MTSSVAAITARRRAMIQHWRGRRAALAQKEVDLHAKLDPSVERVIASKNVLLFSEMLKAIHYPKSDELVHYLLAGFYVAGKLPKTGVFPPAKRDAAMSVDDLLKMRKQVQSDVMARTHSTGDHELDEKLYAITEDEAHRGWLEGPLTKEDLARAGAWIPSRRFAVVQGEKVRPIDDGR